MAEQMCGATGCNFLGRDWAVSKDGQTTILSRCNGCAARLRRKGYTVKAGEGGPNSTGKRDWDMTSTNSLESAANWFRGKSGAMLVLVLRAGDAIFAVDEGVTEKDIPGLLHAALPDAYAQLERFQLAQREKDVRKQIRNGTNPNPYVDEVRHV